MRTAAFLLMAISVVGCSSVRPVQHGAMYRSGQLSANQLEQTIRTNGIRTVVNLRGPDPDSRWYQSEQEVCQRLGVRQVDVRLASTEPSRDEVAALLETYQSAEKPILVHSRSSYGSVGLASGIYRAAVLGDSPDQARRELAPWVSYRWPVRSLSDHDRFLRNWEGKRNFYETYQLADNRDLPSPQFDGPSATQWGKEPFRPSRNGESLPPPSLEHFQQTSPPPPSMSGSRPISDSSVRPVVWFGAPIEVTQENEGTN